MLSALDAPKVCSLIARIRAFDVQAEPVIGGGSNGIDDQFTSVFETKPNSSAVVEIKGIIAAMNVDEQRELIALTLIGRGDYAKDDWTAAMAAAPLHPEPSTSEFLLSDPLVSDALEEGLSLFGFSCSDEVKS